MISDDLIKSFEEISEHYSMAREILDLAGTISADNEIVEYRGGRIWISGSPKSMILVIYFDDRANTGKDYWAQALNVSSIGTIHHISQPHLSEAEAKEGRSKYRYIQWGTFLRREHEKVKREARSVVATDRSALNKINLI